MCEEGTGKYCIRLKQLFIICSSLIDIWQGSQKLPKFLLNNTDHLTPSGRAVHFGNETGVSFEGGVILSTSEVRNQWLKVRVLISRALFYCYK